MPDGEAKTFAVSLERRGEAAQGLQKDLLTEVPLLYGSPNGGDPGVLLAKIHREEMVRRNSGGIVVMSIVEAPAIPPLNRTVLMLFALLLVFFLAS